MLIATMNFSTTLLTWALSCILSQFFRKKIDVGTTTIHG
ncbi:hypothetical protein LEP1GSC166_0552 [Leptospira kirschneri]|nr:hypothetical protein LEP1GSC166_1311 [Leptospira kirschneri]EMK11005.1 hypothetical protein LEP1GSC166_0552 [Leptospira kirschneri]